MRLKVGDVAVITGSKFRPDLIGQICTVTKPYEERVVKMPDGSTRRHFRYVVRLMDGTDNAAFSFRNLRPVYEPPEQVEASTDCAHQL